MREDDDKYELKKALAELDKAKWQTAQALKEFSESVSQNRHLTFSELGKKVDEVLMKYVEANCTEESLETTIKEIKEGRNQL